MRPTVATVALLGAALLVAGCGAGSGSGTGATGSDASVSSTPASGGSASEHGWRAAVRREGNDFVVTLTVPGPLQLAGGCRTPLAVWEEDSSGAVVNRSPAGAPGTAHCGAIVVELVPSGQTRTFEARIPAPAGPGTYSIHGSLSTLPAAGSMPAAGAENLPVLTVRA